jgi:hypothetical protein
MSQGKLTLKSDGPGKYIVTLNDETVGTVERESFVPRGAALFGSDSPVTRWTGTLFNGRVIVEHAHRRTDAIDELVGHYLDAKYAG